jgi:hypothetical protein
MTSSPLARQSAYGSAAGGVSQPNPFVNCLKLSPVGYADQGTLLPPILVCDILLPDASNGLTIELWFSASFSGILVGQPMLGPGGATLICPVLWIDSQGRLAGGLFDGTVLNLVSPTQTLVASLDSSKAMFIGPPNSLHSPMTVMDSDWHHAALVVATPGGDSQPLARQSLYLDGRLVDTRALSSGSFTPSFQTDSGNFTAGTSGQLGGTIIPVAAGAQIGQLNYTPGFAGSIDELRTWKLARTSAQLQQAMSTSLGTQQPLGLYFYQNFDSLPSSLPKYLQSAASTVPWDPWTQANLPLLAGCQNYGIYAVTPFSNPGVALTFTAGQPQSLKIGLRIGDGIQIIFPPNDQGGDNLEGKFSVVATEGTGGNAQSSQNPIDPGDTVGWLAPRAAVYRIDLEYSQSATVTVTFLAAGGAGQRAHAIADLFPNFAKRATASDGLQRSRLSGDTVGRGRPTPGP